MSNQSLDSILDLFSKEQFQEALDAIEEVVLDKSKEALLFNIRGACYAGLNNLKIAKENYEKAISLNPEYSKAYFNLAGVFHELEDLDASIQSYYLEARYPRQLLKGASQAKQ